MPGDSYRPTPEGLPPPPPPGTDSYRPHAAGPPPDMYHFRGQAAGYERDNTWRNDRARSPTSNVRPGRDFQFRSDVQGPTFSRDFPQPTSSSIPTGPRRDRHVQRGGQRGGFRGGFRGASGRIILRSKRETTPERLTGMDDGLPNFKTLEDLSDSEAEMELASEAGVGSDMEQDLDDLNGQPPTKKTRTEDSVTADTVPKWSNPDPYTSLPPPDESQVKKRDVVKLIRKAKIPVEQEQPTSSLAADNADFISFNFDNQPDTRASSPLSDSPRSSSDTEPPAGVGIQRFSHLDNLHPNRTPERPRPLAERIELPAKPQKAATHANGISATASPGSRFHGLSRTVSLDTWPPPDVQAAVAESKRQRERVDVPPPLPTRIGPPRQGKKRKREEITGLVVSEWMSPVNETSTPWCRADYSMTESVGFWLHKEIRDFYDFVKPHEFERIMREDLISRISRTLAKAHPSGQLHSFGSFAAGIHLPTADMDLVWVSDSYLKSGYPSFGLSLNWMKKTRTLLEREGIALPGAEVIWGAKVPIVKLIDRLSNIRVDISFENMTGVTANDTFQAWKSQFPAMPIIVTLIKQFLLMRGLNEVFMGGLGGFSVTCLVTSLLQNLPVVQSGKLPPELDLGEILLDFFDLYGNKFNFTTTAISMDPPGYFLKVTRT